MKKFWIIISVCWLWTCGGGGGGSSPTEPQEPAPVSNFTATPTTLIQGQAVIFTSTSTGTITSYAWNVDNDPAIEGTTATYSHTYTEVGTYSVTLTVTGPGGSNPKTVADMITVSTAAPTPTTETSQTVQEDGSTTISLTATDPNGQAVTFAITTDPTNGTATLSGTEITYTPNANFYGTDSFDYTASNGTYTSDPVTITITVEGEDDGDPTTNDVSATTDEDTAVTLTLDATEIDGDTYSFSIISQPTNGTLGSVNVNQVEYTPNQDFNGTDTFTFEAADDRTFRRNVATATITVNAVNDAPVANDVTASMNENKDGTRLMPVTITLDATDVEGDDLTYSIVGTPSNGTLGSITNNQVVYTPTQDWNGEDTFTYKANDGTDDSNTATVTVTVTSVNDAPVTEDQSASTDEDTAVEITLTATDVENDNLTFTIVSDVSNGTTSLSGATVTYTPTANFNGTDTFTFKANDGTDDSNTSTVTITVASVNDAPVANDVTASTTSRMGNMRQSVDITLSVTDADGDDLTISIVNDVSNGTTSLSGSTVTYTPTANYDGTDTFTYKANDGTVDSNIATGTITVENVNLPPTGQSATYTTPDNFTIKLQLFGEDDNLTTNFLTFSIDSQPSNGSVSLSSNIATYKSSENFSGTDSFTYKVNDAVQDSDASTITLNIINAEFINAAFDYNVMEGSGTISNTLFRVNDVLVSSKFWDRKIVRISEDFQTIEELDQVTNLGASNALTEVDLDVKDNKIFITGKSGNNAGFQEYDTNLNLISEKYISLNTNPGPSITYNAINHSDGGKVLIGLHGGDDGVQRFYAIKLSSNLDVIQAKEWINNGSNEFGGLGGLDIDSHAYKIRETSDGGYIMWVGNKVIKTNSSFSISWFDCVTINCMSSFQGATIGKFIELSNGDYALSVNNKINIYNNSGLSYSISISSPTAKDFIQLSNGNFIIAFMEILVGNEYPTFTLKEVDLSGNVIWEKSHQFFEMQGQGSVEENLIGIASASDGNLWITFEGYVGKFDASNGEIFSLD